MSGQPLPFPLKPRKASTAPILSSSIWAPDSGSPGTADGSSVFGSPDYSTNAPRHDGGFAAQARIRSKVFGEQRPRGSSKFFPNNTSPKPGQLRKSFTAPAAAPSYPVLKATSRPLFQGASAASDTSRISISSSAGAKVSKASMSTSSGPISLDPRASSFTPGAVALSARPS